MFTEKSLRCQESIPTDYRIYSLTIKDVVREGLTGAAVSALASYTFYRSLIISALLVPVSFVLYPGFRREALRKKREWELILQFREAIWIISGFLSAGLSVENAFSSAVPELERLFGRKAMIVREFETIVRGISLNKPVEGMLNDFAFRSGVGDIRSFAEVFSIAKRSGGSLKDIIERTGSIIRDKTAVTEEIKNMTAAKRYEQSLMNILPFLIILYIDLTSDGFLDVMYETMTGRLIMTVCLILIGISCLISGKILNISV